MHVHIVNAHLTYPNWSEGALTRTMVEAARTHLLDLGHEITQTRIEDSYDPQIEVQRHLDARLVILQTPVNWFGAPWIYKRYVDEVFNAGLHSTRFLETDGRTRSDPSRQYGTGGHLHGRGFLISSTWNAPRDTFSNPGSVLFGGKSVDDLLLGLSTSYKFVGYTVLESYGLYDIFRNPSDVEVGIKAYGAHLDRQLAALDAPPSATPDLPS
ncbi:NAD(P)H-dependent oxidoreductase [Kineosporia mesophila]|uniref:NAD(P)H-dependent oxidoreductase n=1 Tax=Kineosporia mesophila TaxID=566012 RepID=A0ABP6Z775_9ACTN|nr:NAD(P)H-dependent oxidoreductase [Kineosporia mesophila]